MEFCRKSILKISIKIIDSLNIFKETCIIILCYTYIVKLEVESASVADRLPLVVPPPQGCGVRLAVGTNHSCPTVTSLQKTEHSKDMSTP